MATITGNIIVTNYGEQQLLAGTFDVTKIKLGSGIWSPTAQATALNTQTADLAASGALINDGATGYRLHVSGVDGSANAYDIHEFALTDDTDTALCIYSQAAIIASKASGSSYSAVFDFVIEGADPGAITITGPTTWDLPQASTTLKGIIEIATDAEATAGVDTTRAVTPYQLQNLLPEATQSQKGIIEVASGTEVDNGSSTSLAVTPTTLSLWKHAPRAYGRIRTGPSRDVVFDGRGNMSVPGNTTSYIDINLTLNFNTTFTAVFITSENAFMHYQGSFIDANTIRVYGYDIGAGTLADLENLSLFFNILVMGDEI